MQNDDYLSSYPPDSDNDAGSHAMSAFDSPSASQLMNNRDPYSDRGAGGAFAEKNHYERLGERRRYDLINQREHTVVELARGHKTRLESLLSRFEEYKSMDVGHHQVIVMLNELVKNITTACAVYDLEKYQFLRTHVLFASRRFSAPFLRSLRVFVSAAIGFHLLRTGVLCLCEHASQAMAIGGNAATWRSTLGYAHDLGYESEEEEEEEEAVGEEGEDEKDRLARARLATSQAILIVGGASEASMRRLASDCRKSDELSKWSQRNVPSSGRSLSALAKEFPFLDSSSSSSSSQTGGGVSSGGGGGSKKSKLNFGDRVVIWLTDPAAASPKGSMFRESHIEFCTEGYFAPRQSTYVNLVDYTAALGCYTRSGEEDGSEGGGGSGSDSYLVGYHSVRDLVDRPFADSASQLAVLRSVEVPRGVVSGFGACPFAYACNMLSSARLEKVKTPSAIAPFRCFSTAHDPEKLSALQDRWIESQDASQHEVLRELAEIVEAGESNSTSPSPSPAADSFGDLPGGKRDAPPDHAAEQQLEGGSGVELTRRRRSDKRDTSPFFERRLRSALGMFYTGDFLKAMLGEERLKDGLPLVLTDRSSASEINCAYAMALSAENVLRGRYLAKKPFLKVYSNEFSKHTLSKAVVEEEQESEEKSGLTDQDMIEMFGWPYGANSPPLCPGMQVIATHEILDRTNHQQVSGGDQVVVQPGTLGIVVGCDEDGFLRVKFELAKVRSKKLHDFLKIPQRSDVYGNYMIRSLTELMRQSLVHDGDLQQSEDDDDAGEGGDSIEDAQDLDAGKDDGPGSGASEKGGSVESLRNWFIRDHCDDSDTAEDGCIEQQQQQQRDEEQEMEEMEEEEEGDEQYGSDAEDPEQEEEEEREHTVEKGVDMDTADQDNNDDELALERFLKRLKSIRRKTCKHALDLSESYTMSVLPQTLTSKHPRTMQYCKVTVVPIQPAFALPIDFVSDGFTSLGPNTTVYLDLSALQRSKQSVINTLAAVSRCPFNTVTVSPFDREWMMRSISEPESMSFQKRCMEALTKVFMDNRADALSATSDRQSSIGDESRDLSSHSPARLRLPGGTGAETSISVQEDDEEEDFDM